LSEFEQIKGQDKGPALTKCKWAMKGYYSVLGSHTN